jgi:drug/metabolite transporter (DMT)-like permease
VVTSAPARSRTFAPRDTALLLTLGGMWGLSFLFIEVALRGLTPLWIVAGRTLVGALFLLLVLRARRQPIPRATRLWGHLFVLGVVSNAVPWGAVAWAQQAIPSGLAALLMALVPTSTLVVSVLLGMERFSPGRALGLLLALGGVGLTVAADLSDTGRLIAIAVIVAATILYALGAVYAKRFVSGTASPLTIATGQVASAGVVSLVGALVLDPLPTVEALTPTVLGSVVALGTLGTGAAFLVFYILIDRVGATNTTLVTYLIPLVAVVAGAVVLGERLPPEALAGGALIGVGIWLAQRGTRPDPVEALEELPH